MKKYIIIIALLATYLIISFLLLGNKNNKKKNNDGNNNDPKTEVKEDYIIFHDDVVLKKTGNSFVRVHDNEYTKRKLYTFENGKYIGEYYYRVDEFKKYLYDDQYNPIDFEGELVLNTYDKDMKYCKKEKQKLNEKDIEVTKAVLKEYEKTYNSQTMKIAKYSCDIDNDGKADNIYTLDLEEYEMSNYFSIIYASINDKIHVLSSTTDAVLLEILDIDKDKELEIITTEIYNAKSCYKVLKYNEGSISYLKNCN